jgi:phosphonate transport system substrate-binding protein
VYHSVWNSFLEHLSATIGEKVQFFSVQSNAAQLAAMRSGRLQVQRSVGSELPSFVLFTMTADRNGLSGHEM